uniref:Uncharacterized protein n=1 Tax=Fagus sylvatica TaxID=28930 RepID=A0A2N9HT81_FAGSY
MRSDQIRSDLTDQFRSDLIRSDLDLIRSDLVRSDLDLIRSDLIRSVRIETGGGLPWERLGAGKGGWAFATCDGDRCDGVARASWARVEGWLGWLGTGWEREKPSRERELSNDQSEGTGVAGGVAGDGAESREQK